MYSSIGVSIFGKNKNPHLLTEHFGSDFRKHYSETVCTFVALQRHSVVREKHYVFFFLHNFDD